MALTLARKFFKTLQAFPINQTQIVENYGRSMIEHLKTFKWKNINYKDQNLKERKRIKKSYLLKLLSSYSNN
jgi:hypothetical protein